MKLNNNEMKLTKKQQEYIKDAYNRACVDWRQEIKENFPKLFKNQLETGKWYRGLHKTLAFITEIRDSKAVGYGFNTIGEWIENDFNLRSRFPWGIDLHDFKEATKGEVREALIKEAKKRGFKKGNKTTCLIGYGKNVKINEGGFIFYNKKLWVYADVAGDIICIFKDGIWAEIQPEVKEMTLKEISKELGYEVKVVK